MPSSTSAAAAQPHDDNNYHPTRASAPVGSRAIDDRLRCAGLEIASRPRRGENRWRHKTEHFEMGERAALAWASRHGF